MPYMTCPACGLMVAPRGHEPAIEFCPRCRADGRRGRPLSPLRPGQLLVDERGSDGRISLRLAGELDFLTAHALEARVVQLCSSGASDLTLELGDVAFADARGVVALLTCRRRCEARRCAFTVTGAPAHLRRLLAGASRRPALRGDEARAGARASHARPD